MIDKDRDGHQAEDAHWYGGSWKWESEQIALRAATPLLAELSGAGVVGADADDAYWCGASTNKGWDVSGNGRRVNVKRAWMHDEQRLGFGGPYSGSYDGALVDDIMLVHLEDEDVGTDHAYEPDGTVRFEMKGQPKAVYRIPVDRLNVLMRRDGKSWVRWLVSLSDVRPYRVR